MVSMAGSSIWDPEPTVLLTDYLVVGAGAMGMPFLDELIRSSTDVEAIILDMRAAPGGHWNDAYDFVRLHQPAETYGVPSRSLGSGGGDLASKPQILEHFELALAELVATGRVRWFPQCRYLGEGRFVSVVDPGLRYEVVVQEKVVDATRTSSMVPATTPPNFTVDEGVNFVPINGLTDVKTPWERYMVIGAGKTGMDAIVYLLEQGVRPDRICWIISNDCWYILREAFVKDEGLHLVKQSFEAVLLEDVTTHADFFLDLERRGVMARLDRRILPTKFRAPTVSRAELEQVGRVGGTVRRGRVATIKRDRVLFLSGQVTR
jgi:hypothetical protein